MEPLGKKLQQARLAKSISLEEASRVTKIRPSRIEEIEAEDFSSFPSLAYAKGFLLIYGKFLEVDVTPYLEAFETSNRVTVDGYSYLQGDGGGAAKSPIVHRQPAKRPALFPFFIAVGVLVVGLYLMKLFLDIQRITPPDRRAPGAAVAASATPGPATPAPGNIVAPRAIPVEGTPPDEAAMAASSTPLPAATVQPPPPAATEPEVRRAQPVHPEQLNPPKATPSLNVAADASPKATPSPTVAIGRVQITPVRKTFVRVIVDNNAAHPAFEGWLAPSDPPLSFRAQHVRVKVLERGAIQITKNGAPVRTGDSNVHIE
jgi:cytoskeleton protein RodZ